MELEKGERNNPGIATGTTDADRADKPVIGITDADGAENSGTGTVNPDGASIEDVNGVKNLGTDRADADEADKPGTGINKAYQIQMKNSSIGTKRATGSDWQ